MRTVVIETFEEFAARQACDHVISGTMISGQGMQVARYVFKNGAISDRTTHWDPDPNVRENLKRIKMYLTTKLKQEEQDFFRAKNSLLERAALAQRYTNFAAPSADEAEVLRQGQARVLKLREELAAVNEQLKDPEAERRRQEIEAEQQQRRSRDADVEAAIRSISIGPVNANGQVVSYLI